MYRIRTAAGTETNYSSLEEFTVAVRRGAVHPEDEIFHTRANRWLDVKSHPHYRSALEGHSSAPTAPAPVVPAPAPAATQVQHHPAFTASPAPQPAPRPVQAPAPAPAPVLARAQVIERPAPVAPKPEVQTQVHPQLKPQGKSKDLTF